MSMMYLCSLLLFGPSDAAAVDATQAAAFVTAGEAHLRRAMDDKDHPLGEFEGAHKNFETAYLVAEDPQYLCRALAAAELALLSATFSDEQERLSWEEVRREDLNQLREDAKEKQRANCRFDAEGKPPPPRVAVLSDADLPELNSSTSATDATSASSTPPTASAAPATTSPTSPRSPSAMLTARANEPPTPAPTRVVRAKTVSGSIFTAAGIGLIAGSAVVVGFEVLQRGWEMDKLVGTAMAEQRKFTTAEFGRFNELKADLLHGRDVAIGVGVAGLVSLGAGIALLVTRKRAPRSRVYAFHPYGSPQGAGAVLRLRF